MQLRQGDICTADMTPQRGKTKPRPVIIISKDEEIVSDSDVRVVAVSTTFRLPLSPDQIELPWDHSGNCATGLRRRSVAVCNWIDRIPQDCIKGVRGHVSPMVLLRILDRVKLFIEESPSNPKS